MSNYQIVRITHKTRFGKPTHQIFENEYLIALSYDLDDSERIINGLKALDQLNDINERLENLEKAISSQKS